ncbi:penicillin-binding transpeptidase domain-containing protein [Peptoanaerobacter stomatis]
MNNNDLTNRFYYIYRFIVIVCIILCVRIIYINVVEGEYYSNIANDSIYKDITIPAPRGEIRDRNGILLAGNKPIFTVKISKNEIDRLGKTDKQKKEQINIIALKLSNILIKNKEKIEDSLPILIQDSDYKFTFDEDIRKWKELNKIPLEKTAKESFYIIVENYQKENGITLNSDLSVVEVQKILNEAGIYPPISVKDNMEFTRQLDKEQWLYKYGIQDKNISAKDAFIKIRENRRIDETLTDLEARNILVIVDAVESKGYLQYEPALIAKDISQKTVALIQENRVDLTGVSVQVEPLRYYPQGNLASHIIGQIGKISSQDEYFLEDERYSKSDYVGKSGIEYIYEKHLKGTNGYEKVLVDSAGKKIRDIDHKEGVSGNKIFLSIDAKLQKVAEISLEKTLKTLQVGGVYESKWGNTNMAGATKIYKNANAGAIVALDIKTGKVLAMASYPSYDPNIFTNGLTKAQYDSLQPENPNDPLSPKPLFNSATMTAVQPGSIFKMVSALAGLENGLDPYYSIQDKGYIDLGGGAVYGNWLWNQSRQTQGYENVITALKDSNNYYFYCISVGYNFATDQKIPMGDMKKGKAILDMARKFKLDQKTGIEIYEVAGTVPDPKVKYEQKKALLKDDITEKMKDKFNDITPSSNEAEYKKRVDTIISWIDENPSRAEIISRLSNLKVKSSKLEEIADLLKYTYFMHADWTTGDIFNMAIGQGEHQYTPIQIARYISAIANGGYLNTVSVVDKLVNKQTGEDTFIENERLRVELSNYGNLEYIKQGMIDVTDEGTAKDIFSKFPIRVAAKTGTAETQGKIPTKDEVNYYLSHLDYYNVDRSEVLKLAGKIKSESKYKYKEEYYIKSAILQLNPRLKLDNLDTFKETYSDYSWFVAYAPYDNPQIAVVTLLFQGGSGGHAGPATRDVIAQYMGIYDGEVKLHDEKDDLKIKVEQTEENKDKITTYTLPTQQTYVQELYSQPKVENKPSQEVAIPKKEEPEIEIKSEQKTSEDKAPAENEQQQEQPASYEDEGVIFDESNTP